MKRFLALLSVGVVLSLGPCVPVNAQGFFSAGGMQSVPDNYVKRLSGRVLVDLTTAADTILYTVPTGKTAYVDIVEIEGSAAITGTLKSAALKIGTTGNSYAEITGSSGYTFSTSTGTSLLPLGATIKADQLVPVTLASSARKRAFPAGSVIKANISGAALPDTGSVIIELIGYEQ